MKKTPTVVKKKKTAKKQIIKTKFGERVQFGTRFPTLTLTKLQAISKHKSTSQAKVLIDLIDDEHKTCKL